MIITHKLTMDLARHSRPNLTMVQGDGCTRRIELTLLCNGVPWNVPQDVRVLVRYRKPNLKRGAYDTLPDGSSAAEICANLLTVTLAPDVLSLSGEADLVVALVFKRQQGSTFNLHLTIQPGYLDAQPQGSGGYITAFLPAPENAREGQYLVVQEVDDRGNVLRVAAVDSPNPPPYVQEEACRLVRAVQSHQNERTLSFLAVSDFHHGQKTHKEQLEESLLHLSQGVGLVSRSVCLDFAAMLGDLVSGSEETPEQALDAMGEVSRALWEGFHGIPNFRIPGECDLLPGGGQPLSQGQLYANTGIFHAGAATDNPAGGYCLRDFTPQKLRVICVNTLEDPTADCGMSRTQLSWLEQALDLSGNGTDWKSLLLSHHPLDIWGSGSPCMDIVNGASGLLCNIHGHTHSCGAGYLDGSAVHRIGVPGASFLHSNDGASDAYAEDTAHPKIPGTKDDTAFCVITVDPATRRVYADHYGAAHSSVITCGPSSAVYSVRYTLSRVTSSNSATVVTAGLPYTTTLSAAKGCTLSTVKVTMGGADITAQVYANGTVTIPSVTGAITITAAAV